jgi:hypothetical protein
MAGAKKCEYIQSLVGKNSAFNVHVLKRAKGESVDQEHFQTLINLVKKTGGKKIGSLLKLECAGSFIPSWSTFLQSNQMEQVEIASALGLFLSVKDESEMVRLRNF